MVSPQSSRSFGSSHSDESYKSAAETIDSQRRPLLFGEIDPATIPPSRLHGSRVRCNVLVSRDPHFARFWTNDTVRNTFLSHCDKSDLKRLRLVCHDFSGKAEPDLFKHLSINFKTRTFSNMARMTHLERIGRNVETFTFNMPQSSQTVLPPLINVHTGEEQSFTYTPHASIEERPSSAHKVKDEQFGSHEIADMLTAQYPPLFHAATNVSAFIRAFSVLPNLRHVRVNCPGKERSGTYRRSTIDYALISLRIALEHATLDHLDSFSIMSLHEEGLLYLQPLVAFGASPRSSKRWSSIKHLNMRLQSHDACDPKKTSTLKILHAYLNNFPSLVSFKFQWQGGKGPMPLTLHNEPRLISIATKYEGSRTPPMQRFKFPELRCFVVQNATTDAWQISDFLSRIRRQLLECDFQDVELRSGDWDQALEPLMLMWKRSRLKRQQNLNQQKLRSPEMMDVPIMLSPEASISSQASTSVKVQKQVSFESYPGHPACKPYFAPSSCDRTPNHRHSRTSKAIARAKEHLCEGTEHLRNLVRLSSFAWR